MILTPEEKVTIEEFAEFLGDDVRLTWAEWVALAKAIIARDAALTNQCTRIATLPQNQPPQASKETGNRGH